MNKITIPYAFIQKNFLFLQRNELICNTFYHMRTNKIVSSIGLALLVSTMMLYSCKKDNNESLPVLSLKTDAGYTINHSYLSNHIIKFGIIATGIDANITNLVIKCIGKNFTKTIVDEGSNTGLLEIDKTFTNVWGDSLQWTVTVMDHNRNYTTLNLITYDTTKTFAPIHSYTNIEMGMQNNTTLPQLLNAVNGTLYTLTQGQQSSQLIDVLCYYYFTGTPLQPSYTFSSANAEDITAPIYYPIINSFNTRNKTDWDYKTTWVDTLAFNKCNSDSLLVASYQKGSYKYKYTVAGKVIPFKTAAGKIGLIKVLSVSGTETGKIVFDLKIQQ
ncbi:MAG: hypothetical protein ACOYLE_10010 [Bacteroidales bacterium]